MRTCLYCGIAVEDRVAHHCPQCGKPLPHRSQRYTAQTLTAERIRELQETETDIPAAPPSLTGQGSKTAFLLMALAIAIVMAALFFS